MKPEVLMALFHGLTKVADKDNLDVRAGIGITAQWGRPLPIVTLAFDGPQAVTDGALIALRQFTKARPIKGKFHYHRFNENAYRTDRIKVRFSYRDGQDDETIRLTINVDHPELPATDYVYDVVINQADKFWFAWKAAYQENGYFALTSAFFVPHLPGNQGPVELAVDESIPYYILRDLDFDEVATWEKIVSETDFHRQNYDK